MEIGKVGVTRWPTITPGHVLASLARLAESGGEVGSVNCRNMMSSAMGLLIQRALFQQ